MYICRMLATRETLYCTQCTPLSLIVQFCKLIHDHFVFCS